MAFTEHLALEGIKPSIGTVGDAFDNALMQTIIGLFKTECIRTTVFHAGACNALADVEFAVAGWVDWSRYAGDPMPGRRDRAGEVAAAIGDLPCRSTRVSSAPPALVAVT